ncbi:PSD1 and planctomycete cytochrome C domain-containing protein [Verrucomicrobiales bacterium]|nr:PSD1 and planctomycete cytochrome C domain-containing protein [Verrucomicrobiales bacterium]MDC0322073.1 PSD1 and planctomycete cytochrome C domain-containing protein [Verrucomicrobiales bacterium]
MQKLIPIIAFFVLVFSADARELTSGHAERMKAGLELFQATIRPALVESCLKCHGDEKVRSGFDISSRELLLKGGDSGDAIDLAKPKSSFLLGLIKHEEEPEMPPKKDKLADTLIADFQKWIELGAPYDKPLLEKKEGKPGAMRVTDSDREFWSFKRLANAVPPTIESDWATTEIDQFVFAKLRGNNLAPNPPATNQARIRRAYLDMIGLPPTPEQLKAAHSMNHAELVDELLASPHYGERWARHWLDAARFAESHGFEQDYDRKFAYHYRDFVIKALNADMPWDQFVQYQLAGDEIAPDDPLAMMATGFLGAGVFPTQLTEKEFESARYDELDDMAATTGTAMLGLTIGCARCHDHKFDPIPVKDYYRFVSTFTTTIRSEIDIDLDPEGYKEALTKWEVGHADLVAEKSAYESKPEVIKAFNDWLKSDAASLVSASDWTTLEATEAISSQSATMLTTQADGAILATGKTPAKETYTVKANTQLKEIRQVRIEALTDPSMKRKGPGRAGNGNFALSNFKVLSVNAEDKKQPLKLVSAEATHQQNTSNLSVASSFDSNPDGTGWAVDAGGIGKDQAAVFKLEKPLQIEKGTTLQFELRFANNGQHSLGKFRLSVSGSEKPPVVVGGGQSDSLNSAMGAMLTGILLPEHRKTFFAYFAKSDVGWKKVDAAVQQSLAGKPQPSMTKVQVTSEGFPPTKHHADGRGFPHFYPKTHFLNRGDPNQKLGVAESGYLQVLMRNDKTTSDWQKAPPKDWDRTSHRRLGLANWMTDTENGAGHLLARVAVNRIWHHHFGRGIVATPNDFGLQGTLATHPELLDYLAQRLITNGWSIKALHRDILLSATWQQSSAASPEKAAIDPINEFLWRFTPRRLEAEIVRDSILAAAGQLDPKMYGPGTLDENQQRRSIYFMIKRSRLVPMMQIFDQPEPLASQGSRPSTTIAPQALLFMNNAQVVKWARALAASVSAENPDDAIRELYLRTLTREPSSAELQDSRAFIKTQSASYNEAKDSRQLALADLCQVLFSLNEFVYLP